MDEFWGASSTLSHYKIFVLIKRGEGDLCTMNERKSLRMSEISAVIQEIYPGLFVISALFESMSV